MTIRTLTVERGGLTLVDDVDVGVVVECLPLCFVLTKELKDFSHVTRTVCLVVAGIEGDRQGDKLARVGVCKLS